MRYLVAFIWSKSMLCTVLCSIMLKNNKIQKKKLYLLLPKKTKKAYCNVFLKSLCYVESAVADTPQLSILPRLLLLHW